MTGRTRWMSVGTALRGGDAVGVEDRVDVAERIEQRSQRVHVPDLRDVPVLRELILDDAAVRDDVRAVLGEGPGDVLEQPRAVPRVDGDLDAEALRRAAVPVDRREALRVPHQRLDVRAVLTVDGDPLAERDVARDRIAGDRRAALREPHEDALGAGDVDAEALARDGAPRPRRLERNRLLLRDLVGLEAVQDLVDDLARGQLPRAERDVEVLALLESALADDLGEHGRAGDLPVREALGLERLLE